MKGKEHLFSYNVLYDFENLATILLVKINKCKINSQLFSTLFYILDDLDILSPSSGPYIWMQLKNNLDVTGLIDKAYHNKVYCCYSPLNSYLYIHEILDFK